LPDYIELVSEKEGVQKWVVFTDSETFNGLHSFAILYTLKEYP